MFENWISRKWISIFFGSFHTIKLSLNTYTHFFVFFKTSIRCCISLKDNQMITALCDFSFIDSTIFLLETTSTLWSLILKFRIATSTKFLSSCSSSSTKYCLFTIWQTSTTNLPLFQYVRPTCTDVHARTVCIISLSTLHGDSNHSSPADITLPRTDS